MDAIEQLVIEDCYLFKTSFPNVKFNWETIKFVSHDKCSTEYLNRHKGYDPKDEAPTFYSPMTDTVVYDSRLMLFDYVRYHEMGHVVHDKLLGNRNLSFSRGWQSSLVKHWDIPNYKRPDHLERFADVFADTMLRLKHNCIMNKYNDEMIREIFDADFRKEFTTFFR